VLQLALDLFDQAVEVGPHAQHFGSAVVEDVRDFGWRESPVDADRNRACLRGAEHELIEQVRVLVEETNAAAGP
jgi:hypothetical protein